jgi:hypothetical protein
MLCAVYRGGEIQSNSILNPQRDGMRDGKISCSRPKIARQQWVAHQIVYIDAPGGLGCVSAP